MVVVNSSTKLSGHVSHSEIKHTVSRTSEVSDAMSTFELLSSRERKTVRYKGSADFMFTCLQSTFSNPGLQYHELWLLKTIYQMITAVDGKFSGTKHLF